MVKMKKQFLCNLPQAQVLPKCVASVLTYKNFESKQSPRYWNKPFQIFQLALASSKVKQHNFLTFSKKHKRILKQFLLDDESPNTISADPETASESNPLPEGKTISYRNAIGSLMFLTTTTQ